METIGFLELNSIAKGIEAADAMLKAAEVRLIAARPSCPGKYHVLVTGEVAAVQSSVDAGAAVGAGNVVDQVVIPRVHPQVIEAIGMSTVPERANAVGILEYFSVTASIQGADAAVKAADVTLIEVRLGTGIGGKSYVARKRPGCWSARWSSPVPIWSCSRICTEGGDCVAEEKQRIIQEFVPGKQVTLAHIIANPVDDLFKKLGVMGDNLGAIGILTITPSEAAIIAGDVASKAAGVSLAFVDRFSGSVVISGDVESVEASLNAVMDVLSGTLQFTPAPITKT